jgi:hypothetical protein
MARKLITVPPDGMNVGAKPSDQWAGWGAPPVPQRSTNMQQVIQGGPIMALTCYSANVGAIANATANYIATANAVCNGIATTDFVVAGNWPAAVANCSYFAFNANIAASNVAMDQFSPTTAAGANGANVAWTFAALRGAPYATPTWVPTAVSANSGSIQTLTLAPTANAVATATINASGQLTAITMSNVGAGYWVPPTVVITPAAPVTDDPISAGGTGTANGAPITANYYAPTGGGLPPATGGSGASAVAVVANGNVTGCIITNPGSGYTAAPTISFIGGTYCAPGMMVQVNTLAAQANCTITNAYVSNNNQVTLSYFNSNTTAAITPTANNIRVLCFNEFPALSPVVSCAFNYKDSANGTANQVAAASTATLIQGLTSNDICIGATPIAVTDVHTLVNSGVVGSGNLTLIGTGITGVANIGAAANYNAGIYRSTCPAPLNVFAMYLTANANTIPASNVSEVVYNVPTGITIQANAPTFVNFLSPVANQFIGGVRANSSGNIAVNWVNATNTATANPGGWLLVGSFQTLIPTVNANQLYGNCTQMVSQTINQVIDNINDYQHALVNFGIIKGA